MDACAVKAIYDEAVHAKNLAASNQSVPEQLKNSTERVTKLIKDYLKYVEDMASPVSSHVDAIIQFTNSTDWDEFSKNSTFRSLEKQMLTGHEEAQVLRLLVSMSKATRVLEIGMFTGCAALAMAEVLPNHGTVITCEINPALEDVIRKFFDKSPHGNKISIKIGTALDTMQTLHQEGTQFDFVFIDADKSNYGTYFKFLLDKNLLAEGGTICVDNTLWNGNSYLVREERDETMVDAHAIPEFNQLVAEDERVYRVILPVRDGIMLIRRKADVDGGVKP